MKGRTKDKINPAFDDFVVVSRKQIELAIYIRQFRRIHQLSQNQMARICTQFGKSKGIKFNMSEISKYENYQTIPTPKKFNILMNTMDITRNML